MKNESIDTALLVYVLNLMSVVTGVTAVIGIILIVLERGKKISPWLQSHYYFQLHSFWKSIAFFLLGFLLLPIYVGVLIWIALLVWWVWRNVKGVRLLRLRRPIPNPGTWWV